MNAQTSVFARFPQSAEVATLFAESLMDLTPWQLFDKDRFSSEFMGQTLVPLHDLTHDGQPMGFDLTLQQPADRKVSGTASIAVELTYNPLNLGSRV